jgi:mutator family transposase
VETWVVKYDKAVECLIKDRDALLAFYDFPAEHWKHLRTTNVIESSFATVRHRTVRSKGCLSNKTALAMIFKLAEAAERSWRRLNGHNQLSKIILGVKFPDGIEVVRPQAQAVAAWLLPSPRFGDSSCRPCYDDKEAGWITLHFQSLEDAREVRAYLKKAIKVGA